MILVKRFGLTVIKAAKIVEVPYHKAKKYKINQIKEKGNSFGPKSFAAQHLLQQAVSSAILRGILTECDCEKIHERNFDHLVVEPLLADLKNDFKSFIDKKSM